MKAAQSNSATTHTEPQWHTVRKTLYRVLVFVTKACCSTVKQRKNSAQTRFESIFTCQVSARLTNDVDNALLKVSDISDFAVTGINLQTGKYL